MTKKFKEKMIRALYKGVALFGAFGFLATAGLESLKKGENLSSTVAVAESEIKEIKNANVNLNTEKYFDSSVVMPLPETVAKDEEISVIVTMNTASLVEVYKEKDTTLSLTEYVATPEAKKLAREAKAEQDEVISLLKKSGISYSIGERYDTVLNGFEVIVKGGDFEKLQKTVGNNGSLIISETYYQPAVTEIVTNDVDTYETGIFNSQGIEYQGDGVVVAVLDTGLDYTHSAFSVDNFTSSKLAFTQKSVSDKVAGTAAAKFTKGLTGEDVYMNEKVPFAYDYADKDPDVLPISNSHGTHVAGIIAGKDEVITGVAPNAQLAIMKVFSDGEEGAKDSWLIAALEDCVVLGVDVINMSLGAACGFAREVDKVQMNEVYDSIHEAGISMVVAASNSGNATSSSEKNGSLGLTSNPDSGTVGSPSTYSATLSVASVDGVKTPYFKFGEEIIYFKEAVNASAKTMDFVDKILDSYAEEIGEEHLDSYDFEYVTIPGIGRESDYPDEDDFYKGKIVLVKRGESTFEDKVRIALQKKGAAGIIIYNNVSGDISMSIGKTDGAVCSISQDEGEMLAEQGSGVLHVSREYLAGPFMSSFSSWGPTSGLEIKPEITAHGGEIYSAIMGGNYERMSGTSMACPNQAGATALIRQYVKSGKFGDNLTNKEINALVYQIMMSTTDIVYNKNRLPFAVRKQGSGLVNMRNAIETPAYIITSDENGAMEKTKLELGDDKERTGVYEMSFEVRNISGSPVSYDLGAIIQTEGVSETLTGHGETTVTQEGYLLNTTMTVLEGSNCEIKGNSVTIQGGQTGKISLRVTLSDADKKYLEESFEYGMYIEGFITLKAKSGTTINMSVPVLSFYGDWTEAPIFDEEHYDTHKDEINQGLDPEDKMMADAYATRAIGKLYSDYISELGSYYFVQDPKNTQIAASKDRIAISNQDGDEEGRTRFSVCAVESIWAGFLRNVKETNISIVEDATGIEVFNRTEYNRHKALSSGGSIRPSMVDIEFSALEHKLKNNTRYTVTVETYIDYGTKETQNNARNTFTFPLYIDIQSPSITDVRYYTEYDQSTKKTKLFADLSVYDNHYAMALNFGQMVKSEDPDYMFSLNSFGQYFIPVYSEFNSTSVVTLELTDYIKQIKENSLGLDSSDVTDPKEFANNSYMITCYDYAMNTAMYELRLPDEILAMYFEKDGQTIDEVTLSPHETLDLTSILNVYPAVSWEQVVDFTSADSSVADVINQTLLAKKTGETTIKAVGSDRQGNKVEKTLTVKVLGEGDPGYKEYSPPEVNSFDVYGYKTLKAYYSTSSKEREIGTTDSVNDFAAARTLSMFPSESVQLLYKLDAFVDVDIEYRSNNPKIATVSEDGIITAQAEGSTIVTVSAGSSDKKNIRITVKDPYTTNGMYLMSYKGLGGEVVIPSDRGFTEIYAFAFSNYEYVDRTQEEIDNDESTNPPKIKQWYIGEDTITKIVIPEGVEIIQQYAFANLSALEEVVLPSTLKNIGVGAFYNCTKLKKINLENVQFINERAFAFELEEEIEEDDLLTNAEKEEKLAEIRKNRQSIDKIDLSSIVAIGNYAFKNCWLTELTLPDSSQSLGEGAFFGNKYLETVTFVAPKMKIGPYAFAECSLLDKLNVNAAVISSYAFYNCTELSDVTLGKDVAVLGEYAFTGTNIAKFKLSDAENSLIQLSDDGAFIMKDGVLMMVAPQYEPEQYVENGEVKLYTIYIEDAVEIASGAFAGAMNVWNLIAPNVETIGDYAFAGCKYLTTIELPALKKVGNYAFAGTALKDTLDIPSLKEIGNYAFAGADFTEVVIADDATIGDYAFSYYKETEKSSIDYNNKLNKVTLGNNVKVGNSAFYAPIYLATYEVVGDEGVFDFYYEKYPYYLVDEAGNRVIDENGKEIVYHYLRYDFQAGVRSKLYEVSIGENCVLGEQAFAGNAKLETLSIGNGTSLGNFAFFNATSLQEADLKGVTTFGDYAFGGSRLRDYWIDADDVLRYAYEREQRDGEEFITAYIYSAFAANIKTLDLSSATYIGEGAFGGNEVAETLILGDKLTEIADYAFMLVKNLEKVELPESVNRIGSYAFYNSGLTEINLENVQTIGDYAFGQAKLVEITLANSATIGESAFMSCENLTTVNNLENVSVIGAMAFQKTALTSVKLTNVTELGDYAFGESKVTEVDFGTEGKLTKLGENPFYACAIDTFGRKVAEEFDGTVVGTNVQSTYDVTENAIKVIDGVLYQVVPNGLVLVSYPAASSEMTFVVPEGVVRISGSAFRATGIENVTLPSTLKALGDKAFYQCENLLTVTFKSYEAPMLEEEYDEYYITYEHMPLTGVYYGYEGMGIVPFYMWNITSNYNNFFFGANFYDYVGSVDKTIVMVKPVNGQNYDSFVFSKYFSAMVEGNSAPMAETVKVIAMIDALPTRITLEHKAVIAAARAAFEEIGSFDQKSLVSNISKLTAAEAMIKELEYESGGGEEPVVKPDAPIEKKEEGIPTYVVIIISVCATAAAFLVYIFLTKKKQAKVGKEAAEPAAESEIEPVEENNEPVVENNEPVVENTDGLDDDTKSQE